MEGSPAEVVEVKGVALITKKSAYAILILTKGAG
jgi:hypothetical protein